jgi:hypothetical protein
VASYPKLRNYETDQVITGNSVPDLLDRKHYLAVMGRILNEHEHVAKQILEIVEGAEVGEKSRRFLENNSPNLSYKEPS